MDNSASFFDEIGGVRPGSDICNQIDVRHDRQTIIEQAGEVPLNVPGINLSGKYLIESLLVESSNYLVIENFLKPLSLS
jgi:hypothetical protein